MTNIKIEGVVGPMKTGKTLWLIKKMTKDADTGKRVLYVAPLKDTRTIVNSVEKFTSTHSSTTIELSEKVKRIKLSKFAEITDYVVEDYDSIAIDEIHFFEDVAATIKSNAFINRFNGKVYYSGLDMDSEAKYFDSTLELMKISSYKKIQGICDYCIREGKYDKSNFSVWIGDSPKKERIVPGGSETYASVCYYHYRIDRMRPTFCQ